MRTNLILPASAALSLFCSMAVAQNIPAAPDVAAAQDAAAAGGDTSLETGLDSYYDMDRVRPRTALTRFSRHQHHHTQ